MASKKITVDEAVQAQRALRELAGLEPETFPIEDFVGMISDEIEQLRKQGRSDEEIANAIRKSGLDLTAGDIAANYAPPQRRGHGPQ